MMEEAKQEEFSKRGREEGKGRDKRGSEARGGGEGEGVIPCVIIMREPCFLWHHFRDEGWCCRCVYLDRHEAGMVWYGSSQLV